MKKIYLNFGAILKRYIRMRRTKIYGKIREVQESMVGLGMLRTRPMTEDSISILTKVSSLSPITTAPISGNSSMNKTASKDPICSIRCACKKKSYTTSSADCILASPLT